MKVLGKDQVEIKAGDKVKCVDPIEGYLEHKEYIVVDVLPASLRIVINPDLTGKEGHYKATRFVVSK